MRAVIVAAGTYLDSTVITGRVRSALRAGRPAPRAGAEPVPARPRPADASVQDRNAARASTRAASISRKWRSSAATTTRSRSRSPTREPPENQAVCWLTLDQRAHPRRSSARICDRQPAVSTAPSPASARATARASRRRSSALPTSRATSSSSSPCGLGTDELYLQGFSSSLPEEVQLAMLHTIAGLEHARDDAPGLCHRVRLHRPDGAVPRRWSAKSCPASTARASSTARPAMRRRRCRALWRASTPR